ncbi:MAG: phospho-sugar mutase [Peptococcaceae bacterium]|jgi:phosphoglucomutase|nr:phospho-sugar mutase [Peptococcaceae bacterium]
MSAYYEIYQKWVNEVKDPELLKELAEIKDQDDQIKERFYTNLDFGTGGIRGVLGAGTNRMNVLTVRRATQGVADYLNKACAAQPIQVIIAYDSRHKSREFALESALVLAKNGIAAKVFRELAPTPLLSFAVTHLKAQSGIVITASHNSKEYNGYKLYWSHGGQMTDQRAGDVIQCVNSIQNELSVETMSREEAEAKGLLVWLGDEVVSAYLARVQSLVQNPELVSQHASELKIIYTPLHGAGLVPVTRLFKNLGFSQMRVVPDQAKPDPDFPTVKLPNPEDPAVYELALKMTRDFPADIILGSDPDADRAGVGCRGKDGKYVFLSGNQIGVLILDYLLTTKKARGALDARHLVIKSVVTAQMGVDLAARHGVPYMNVLTGFKYIGELIDQLAARGDYQYLFGYEESYGFLIGDFCRDKDAPQACMILAEAALYHKQNGETLLDRLETLFGEMGCYLESQVNISLPGLSGMDRLAKIMAELRRTSPKTIGGLEITYMKDFAEGGGEQGQSVLTSLTREFPVTNLLRYELKGDTAWCCIRPSGTEPKLKLYFGAKGAGRQEAQAMLDAMQKELSAHINGI